MNEILTDEFFDYCYQLYLSHKEIRKAQNAEPMPFEAFVNLELKIRAWNLRKGGIHVEI